MSCAAQPNLRLRLLVVGSLWAPRPSWVDPRLVSYRAGLQVAPRKHTMGHAYNPVGLLARLSQLCLALHTLHTQRVCVIF